MTVANGVTERTEITELSNRARRGLDVAALDPAEALAIATEVLAELGPRRCWEVVCVAERAMGVALMNLSILDEAVKHLRAAVNAGRRSGGTGMGEARMSLASAHVLRGAPAQALREIEAALRQLEGLPAARARVQYAAIQQELGHHDAALDAVRSALPTLRSHGDAEWAVRAYSNRSLIHAHRRSFGAAERDLQAARALCDQYALDLPAAYAEQNLGCLDAQRGYVPAALGHFEAAENLYERYGLVEPSVLVDRAQVLLSVRVLDEARATAEAAVSAYLKQGRSIHLPEAELLLSTTALLQGDAATASTAAAAALDGFRATRRAGGVAQARYARIQAEIVMHPDKVAPAQVARAARDLEAAGWTVPALEGMALAGRLALERGQLAPARSYLAAAGRARFAGPADARARAWMAEALLRRADGRRAAALSALRAGVRIVDDHQSSLGATELRAHVSAHRGALARLGLQMALEDGRARQALWWAERARASALLSRPVEPPQDPVVAQHLADLRSTMAEIEEARDEGTDAQPLLHRQVILERRIRDRCRQLNGTSGRRSDPGRELAELPALLGERALVEFIEIHDRLHAVTVAGGRVRLHYLCEGKAVVRASAPVPMALRRLARASACDGSKREGDRAKRSIPSVAGTAAALAILHRAAQALHDLLIAPLRADLGDRPLVVVPTPSLQSVPWSLLPGCSGRAVSASPSALLWLAGAKRPPDRDVRATVVVAGPGLRGASEEAAVVGGLYADALVLRDGTATASAVLHHMEGAHQLHLAAHGRVRADNSLFSSVLLDDGPLTVYELERLTTAPRHVTLAACDTGRHQVVAGEEVLGIGAALLGAGTVTLVAPMVSIPDSETVTLMYSYHRHLVAGRRPAEALAAAQAEVDRDHPAAVAAAAGFLCLGAG